jgi:hypothetical protein
MPFQPILPTWLAINNANFTSPTALTDPRTGLPFAAGGLNLGDYFDLTEQEANSASYTTNGTLHSGRYRFVLVDSGANSTNVKTGTVGYLRPGFSVSNVVITAAGTGATTGVYNIAATTGTGGGTGAMIQVVVGSTGTITSATVLQGGNYYVSVPTFSLTITGTSGGTVAAELSTSPNVITDFSNKVTAVRPVVFLNSITPGNYGFIQELGVATVLGQSSSFTDTTIGDWIDAVSGGVVNSRAASGSPTGVTIGQAIDLPVVSNLFKIYMNNVPVVQD